MFIWLNERLRKDDKGFTLIELMVVVLIIAILIAIAIPTFLGARRRAQNRQAQSNLRNGLTAEKTYYADAQVYTDDEDLLGDIESNLDWSTDDGSVRGVAVYQSGGGVPAGQVVALRSLSKSGVMFCIADVAQNLTTAVVNFPDEAGTYYASADPGTPGTGCTSGWDASSSVGWS